MEQLDLLNKFINETVTIKKKHSKEMKRILSPIIQEIVSRVHDVDNRFGDASANFNGSFVFQKLKVKRLDEFEFAVPIMSLKNLHWIHPKALKGRPPIPTQFQKQSDSPEDVLLQVTSDDAVEIHKDMVTVNFVLARTARQIFQRLLTRAIKELRFEGFVTVSSESSSPSTLTIDLKKHGQDVASVDLMLLCPVEVPLDPWICWPRPNQEWPSEKKMKEIKDIGLFVVAKKGICWTMYFAKSEKILITGIDADNGVRRKCHRLMKVFLEDVWCPKGEDAIIISYHLKNVLFWECERYPCSKDWGKSAIAERLNSMLEWLLCCMRHHKLPLYFYPDVNLFNKLSSMDLNRIAAQIRKTMENVRASIFP